MTETLQQAIARLEEEAILYHDQSWYEREVAKVQERFSNDSVEKARKAKKRRILMRDWVNAHNPLKKNLLPGECAAWNALASIKNDGDYLDIERRISRLLESVREAPLRMESERELFYSMLGDMNKFDILEDLVDRFEVSGKGSSRSSGAYIPYAPGHEHDTEWGGWANTENCGSSASYLPEHLLGYLQVVDMEKGEKYEKIYEFGLLFYEQKLQFIQKFISEVGLGRL